MRTFLEDRMHILFRLIPTFAAVPLLTGCLAAGPTNRDVNSTVDNVIRDIFGNQAQRATAPITRGASDAIAAAMANDTVWLSMDPYDKSRVSKNLFDNLDRSDTGWMQERWSTPGTGRSYVSESYAAMTQGWTPLCKFYKLRITLLQGGRAYHANEVTGTTCWGTSKKWEFGQ